MLAYYKPMKVSIYANSRKKMQSKQSYNVFAPFEHIIFLPISVTNEVNHLPGFRDLSSEILFGTTAYLFCAGLKRLANSLAVPFGWKDTLS